MTKYVDIDLDGVVLNPYDDLYGDVPAEAIPITDDEFNILSTEPCSYFSIVDGALIRRPEADDMINYSIVNGVDDTVFMMAFVGILLLEINALRSIAGLPDRTIEQFKSAMLSRIQ